MKIFLGVWIIFFIQFGYGARSVQVHWRGSLSGNLMKYTDEPQVQLSWTVVDEARRSVKYRLKVSPDTGGIDEALTQTLETVDSNARVKLDGPGKYVALLQALDINGKVIANSEVFEFELQRLLTLVAPEILGEPVLTASEEGSLELQWSSVAGANSYSIFLKDFEGRLLKTIPAIAGPQGSKGKYLISNLYPGRYQVQVLGIEKSGLAGPLSEPKYLNVPMATTLLIPKNFQVSLQETRQTSGHETSVNVRLNDRKRSAMAQWDPVEGARQYEIEASREGLPVQIFKASQTSLILNLELGRWSLRVRAADSRGVRTDWTESQVLNLNFEAVTKLEPEDKKIQISGSSREEAVPFRWKAQEGVSSYILEISSQDGAYTESLVVSGESITQNLPVGKVYRWSLRPNGESMPLDTSPFSLTVMGKALEKPDIEMPANAFVRDIEWKAPPFADHYKFLLQRQNRKLNKWENILAQDQHKENSIFFDGKLPGGYYRLLVVAKAPLRQSSPTAVVAFKVKSGDRSPAAEETFEVRQSIDRLSGWFASASYLATVFDYRSTNYDRSNSSLSYSAVGATGRIGFGYFKSPSVWGFLGIYDLSGISLEGKTTTFSSTELSAVHRRNWGRFGEVRNQVGIYYKELPETVGFASTQSISTELVKVLGPQYGFEYWRALDPQFGVQANVHIYLPLLKMKTPNDENIVLTPSWQIGLLGSYRWQRNLTALLGYAYRLDQVKYKAMPGAVNGDTNSLSMAGHYINMYLEWDL